MHNLYFLGSSRCFHTIDWYESAQKHYGSSIPFITDMVDGEGFSCLVKERNAIKKLIIVDRFLMRHCGPTGHKIRNVVKLLLSPIQAILVWKLIGRSTKNLTFAHSTYYAFIAGLAGINYISTPQGSEILERLEKSRSYRFIARVAHGRAKLVTVDSSAMRLKLKEILNIDATVVQNGVDVSAILAMVAKRDKKLENHSNKILSIRGITELYQILEMIKARDGSSDGSGINFCCPFFDYDYKKIAVLAMDKTKDQDLGKLDRETFYNLLYESAIVISVPLSDSSPRSVYEAIFFGCVVIVSDNQFIYDLPETMRKRLVITNCDEGWFDSCLKQARKKVNEQFQPTQQDLQLFDQSLSVPRVLKEL